MRFSFLPLFVLILQQTTSEESDSVGCSSFGDDLYCSACSVFIESYLLRAAKKRSKKTRAEKALSETMKSVSDGSTQWCIMGDKGSQEFVDFNEAMNSGMMQSLSMSPEVDQQIKTCFEDFHGEYEDELLSRVTDADRVYDSLLSENFCSSIGACSAKEDDFGDELYGGDEL